VIFHQPDRSMRRLAAMWRRARRFAKPGRVDPAHRLAAAWSNCRLMLESSDCGPESYAHNAAVLDWFAVVVDEHAKAHMLDGDTTLAAICAEWLAFMPFAPLPVLDDERRAKARGHLSVIDQIVLWGWDGAKFKEVCQ
jgi:hypothetical protein